MTFHLVHGKETADAMCLHNNQRQARVMARHPPRNDNFRQWVLVDRVGVEDLSHRLQHQRLLEIVLMSPEFILID